MQKWDYLIVWLERGWNARAADAPYHESGKWTITYWTAEGEKPWSAGLISLFSVLGNDGWEMIDSDHESNVLGGMSTTQGFTAFGGGKTEGWSTDYAGFTTTKQFTFKRPKL